MEKFEVSGVRGYRGAEFPEKVEIQTARGFFARALGFIKVTLGVAALALLISFTAPTDACASTRITPPPDITGQEAPVDMTVAEFARDPKVYDAQRVKVKGKIVEFDAVSARGNRPIKCYRLEADGVAIELMGKEAKDNIGKTVTVQGYIRIFGQPCKDGAKAFKLSIEKIIQ